MRAILVRIGIDQTYGGWNAPVDPQTYEFVYVPIPEKHGTEFKNGLQREFGEVLPALEQFVKRKRLHLSDLGFPVELLQKPMHLDPDFCWLTYGDNGQRRGAGIANLSNGDLLVFYAGLQSAHDKGKLIYAIVGLYVVDEVALAREIPQMRHVENAHTRKSQVGFPDVVVWGKKQSSGRLTHCLPIGEFRDRAYRVREELLDAWGGLSVRNGFIQRSVKPPHFLNAMRFYEWFSDQKTQLIRGNNIE